MILSVVDGRAVVELDPEEAIILRLDDASTPLEERTRILLGASVGLKRVTSQGLIGEMMARGEVAEGKRLAKTRVRPGPGPRTIELTADGETLARAIKRAKEAVGRTDIPSSGGRLQHRGLMRYIGGTTKGSGPPVIDQMD